MNKKLQHNQKAQSTLNSYSWNYWTTAYVDSVFTKPTRIHSKIATDFNYSVERLLTISTNLQFKNNCTQICDIYIDTQDEAHSCKERTKRISKFAI